MQEWAVPTWEQVGSFVRARRDICFKSEEVCEIAVLYPNEKNSHNTDFLYDQSYKGLGSLYMWIEALQSTGNSCSVIFEHPLAEKASRYPVIVVPDTDCLGAESVRLLKQYAKDGGSLIIDLDAAKYFTDITGADTNTEQKLIFISSSSHLAALDINCMKRTKYDGECGCYYDDNIYDNAPHTAAFLTNHGNGRLISLCFDFSAGYKNNVSCVIENFLRDILKAANFTPIAYADNPFAEVITRKKDNKLLVNLVNTSGNHALPRVRSYNYLPPLYDIPVTVRCEKAPTKVTIEPEHIDCDYTYNDNTLSFTLPRLDIHSVIVIE